MHHRLIRQTNTSSSLFFSVSKATSYANLSIFVSDLSELVVACHGSICLLQNIPVKFFSDHIEGKHEDKIVKLRSDASKRKWKVKMEGQRLTEGWKEFVEAHNLRIGDFVVFRHEGDMKFHVTALGPSCCEIQYAPSGFRDEDEDESDEIGISMNHHLLCIYDD